MDWAYVAGLVDGEGCISFHGSSTPQVQITNTSLPMLKRVQRITGCGRVYKSHSSTEKHRKAYRWECYGKNARRVLRHIAPFLTTKYSQARLLLDLPPDEPEERQALAAEVKRLKKVC